MLSDPKLKSQVDRLWDMLWSGGLSNPMDAIEQLSYLLFLKRMDEAENDHERMARMRGESFTPRIDPELRWSRLKGMQAKDALAHLKNKIFPALKAYGKTDDADVEEAEKPAVITEESSFTRYMASAELKINRPSLLIQAMKLIDEMNISEQSQDVQGDLYEYLLSHLSTAGRNGQFRTPRHIIRMMVQMLDPRKGERIGDLAAGTGGFLVNAYQYILEQNTSPEILSYDGEGWPQNLIGDRLTDAERDHLENEALRGYDNDSGMTMLRVGSMNLMLHGIENPRFDYKDTLGKEYDEPRQYDVILMNPPFKGKVTKSDVNENLPDNTTKSELLFLHQILRVLDMGRRAAVIVPDGVLFGSSRAHVAIRKKLVDENGLMGVVSMPSGVFKPYAGVSTAILLFNRGGRTERIWFYDMAHDGYSLDDKRNPVAENDIPDLLACWRARHEGEFAAARAERLAMLQGALEPLTAERLRLDEAFNRLTFEATIADEAGAQAATAALDDIKAQQAQLQAQSAPLRAEIDQLQRQFWVTAAQVRAQKYDLSASRYREIVPEATFYEDPQVTMQRLLVLERILADEVAELKELTL